MKQLDSFQYRSLTDQVKQGYRAQAKQDLRNVRNGVVLGSGLGNFTDEHLVDKVELSFEELFRAIPGGKDIFQERASHPSLEGHAKKLIIGKLKDSNDHDLVIAQSGREHPYEGVEMSRSVAWIRVMQLLGVESLIGSNASGILTPNTLDQNDLMLIHSDQDQGNDNPLIGPNDPHFGLRFPHMGDLYPANTRKLVKTVANKIGIPLKEGLYVRVVGPNYERREDVYRLRSLAKSIWREGAEEMDPRFLNADQTKEGPVTAVVGMSSTFEQIVAQHATLSKDRPAFLKGRAYISVATNYAAGLGKKGVETSNPTHDEVKESARLVQNKFGMLVRGVIEELRKL